MSEKIIIENTKRPNTVASLYKELIDLGIKKGDILLVHSSLSSIGWICGGPQALIETLLKSVGKNGTLVMPAHSGDWSNPEKWSNPPVPKDWVPIIQKNMPAFDKALTPTRGIGRTAELFRTLKDTLRSDHPLVSFAANGKYAEEITSNHPLNSQFGMNSPLGSMYKLNAKVLLLGVGYDSCTSFHLSEVLTEKMAKEKYGTSKLVDGVREWVWFEDYESDSDDFDKIGNKFEEISKVNSGKIGNADCTLFSMKDGVDFATTWLNANRFAKKLK
ncbi:MAG: AAC(3) family N-acetyltransferase [Clostridiales bacterium]|nr:AAC(3) family N-acetyltransferase [Clostridiales bacterium]